MLKDACAISLLPDSSYFNYNFNKSTSSSPIPPPVCPSSPLLQRPSRTQGTWRLTGICTAVIIFGPATFGCGWGRGKGGGGGGGGGDKEARDCRYVQNFWVLKDAIIFSEFLSPHNNPISFLC